RFRAFAVDLNQVDLLDSEFAQDVIQSPDLALYWSGRMAAVLKAAASIKRAKIYVIGRDGDTLISRPEAIVENRNTGQMRDILLQYAKGAGMRFKPENVGVRKLAMKINNGSTDVAADIENDFRPKG